ncbi:MAG: homing endonuclease [uncultured marine phage]|uniref:Homing endonuclease n=1 Tax=uncultured marine phage TaxID=707152 RepID=A0A8D9FQQ8_9VIRU|nr:MAG: homing endonuclease [uncultured marine phage]
MVIWEVATENNLRLHKEGKLKSWSDNYDWTGKSHTEKSKKKMSESKKGHGKGKSNSQYGTCWITKNGENKKIKKELIDDYITDGWTKGRKSIKK